jgi:hypothetical protein
LAITSGNRSTSAPPADRERPPALEQQSTQLIGHGGAVCHEPGSDAVNPLEI